jgi:hypothetical protein
MRTRTREEEQPSEEQPSVYARPANTARPSVRSAPYVPCWLRPQPLEPQPHPPAPAPMDAWDAADFADEHAETDLSRAIAAQLAGGSAAQALDTARGKQVSFLLANNERSLGRDHTPLEHRLMRQLKNQALGGD